MGNKFNQFLYIVRRTWVFQWYQRHFPHFTRFSLVGGGVFILGLVVLHVCIDRLHLDEIWTYRIVGVMSMLINFLLNHLFVWHDYANFWNSVLKALKFVVSRLATTYLINQLIFAWLVNQGIPWLAAAAIGVGVAGIINYSVGRRFIFSRIPRTKGRTEDDSEN
jgi:putative flippase GtrA